MEILKPKLLVKVVKEQSFARMSREAAPRCSRSSAEIPREFYKNTQCVAISHMQVRTENDSSDE